MGKKVHDQCMAHNVQLIFGQTGNVFIKNGKEYRIHSRSAQMEQALRAGLHYPPIDIEYELQLIQERKEAMKALKDRKREE